MPCRKGDRYSVVPVGGRAVVFDRARNEQSARTLDVAIAPLICWLLNRAYVTRQNYTWVPFEGVGDAVSSE